MDAERFRGLTVAQARKKLNEEMAETRESQQLLIDDLYKAAGLVRAADGALAGRLEEVAARTQVHLTHDLPAAHASLLALLMFIPDDEII